MSNFNYLLPSYLVVAKTFPNPASLCTNLYHAIHRSAFNSELHFYCKKLFAMRSGTKQISNCFSATFASSCLPRLKIAHYIFPEKVLMTCGLNLTSAVNESSLKSVDLPSAFRRHIFQKCYSRLIFRLGYAEMMIPGQISKCS